MGLFAPATAEMIVSLGLANFLEVRGVIRRVTKDHDPLVVANAHTADDGLPVVDPNRQAQPPQPTRERGEQSPR